jgi:hypothetical protein
MQLYHAPFVVSAASDIEEIQGCRHIRVESIGQSLQGIYCEDCAVVIDASKRMRSHKSPLDVWCNVGEEGCEIAIAKRAVDLRDVTFARVFRSVWWAGGVCCCGGRLRDG